MVYCGADTIFTGSDFCSALFFCIEFLAVYFGCLVLTFIGSSMVVVCGVDDRSEKSCFSTSCMISVVHACFNGMGAGFLLTWLVVGILGASVCDVFVLFSVSFGQSRLVVAFPCPQFMHSRVRFLLTLHWLDTCLPVLQVVAW